MNCDYCKSCGGKIEYLLKKPNFCPNCGKFTGSPGAQGSVAPPVNNIVAEEEESEGTDVQHLPSINGLQYEIEGGLTGLGKNHGTIGDLFGTSGPPQSPLKPASSKSQSSPKATASKKKRAAKKNKPEVMPDAIKQSMKECGSSADSPVDVG